MEYPTFLTVECDELIHGNTISDPFRWLENPFAEQTKDFVQKQKALTEKYLEESKVRSFIRDKLTHCWDFAKYSFLEIKGSKFFFYYNSGLQNQSVLYYCEGINGEPKMLIDPNELSKDGTVSLMGISISEDAKIIAYMLSSSGSDWCTIHFKNIETGESLPDVLTHVKFSCLEWSHCNKGIFYNWYPETNRSSADDGTETNANSNQKLRYHFLGTDQPADPICVEMPDQPTWMISMRITHCGRYALVYVSKSCDPKCAVYYVDFQRSAFSLQDPLQLNPLYTDFDASYDYVTNRGSTFYFLTDFQAPMKRIVSVNIEQPDKANWKVIIAHDPKVNIRDTAAIQGGKLVVNRLINVTSSLSLHDLEKGDMIKEFDIPKGGTVSALTGSPKEQFFSFQFTSYLKPPSLFSVQVTDPELVPVLFRETKLPKGLDLADFVYDQVFYESKDGTKVPMFILRHKEAKLDGTAPCQLYGYGGFNISLLPSFSIRILIFLQLFRGVFVSANIRGGGEFGETWYHDGRLDKKQNCFDDFIAAARYLIDKGYTCKERLFIRGGSNGGLLVTACANQAPELFGAAIAEVPVTDLLRFHKFTIGYAWMSDYGNPELPECFEYIRKISPLHNINATVAYPAMMILTADHDDRVVPLHSFKYMASLQKAVDPKVQKQPLLLRIETDAGHGAGKPTAKDINEMTDILTFVQLALNLDCVTNECG